MTDAIAQAAEALNAAPGSAEPAQSPVAEPEVGNVPAVAAASATAPATAEVPNAAATSPAGAATPASTGNVLVNGTPVVDPNVVPAADAGAPVAGAAPVGGGDVAAELPRESHLMLLEHKLAAMHAKFKTGERVAIDEFEQILGHIRAVL